MNSRIVAFLVLSLALGACVNLQSISRYSSHAVKGVEKLNEIQYSFARHCSERCRMAAIDSAKIDLELACPCSRYKRADSVMQALYRAVAAYFHELDKLAGNKLTEYNIDRLKQTVSEEDFGVFQISKAEADAYGDLTHLLLKGLTEAYRQNRLKACIQQGNPAIQVLLAKLEFITDSNLRDLLKFMKERLYDHYRALVRTTKSDYEKQKAASDYYESLEKIVIVEKRITAYSNGLKAVARGHQLLYDNREKLSGKELWDILLPVVSDIQDLITELDRLND